ncbi:shufflon system plasmid conjugative transfer pilus tip adhesin PilV [Pseudomonas moorei]|uniref:shufflon system plasmid conjugative transfer pilus tip adhesin PilV n=1 Tax=Pseudomonas moorei TaxID=395599 RepID=UPI00200FCEC9|nr:shufflon system plasmid conjugative transfer pilus tip adhesin PilV [Pseudomonas moorei]
MTSKNKQRGFLSLDMAIGLIVFSVVVTLATVWQLRQMAAQDYRIAADQQRTISEAQAKYLKDNFSTVLANATATVPVQITVQMLINTNYLPAGFSSTNVFGQTILGLARKPNPNQLEVIVVTTGGQTIPEMGIRAIAENLGGPGGFISTTNPNIIQGVRGGWQVTLSNYAIAPGPGHTASALFLMDGTLANDYLYRNAVPGHPELNTMNTDLGMGNHNINNAGAITASGNVTTNSDVTARNVTASAAISGVTANIAGETYTGGWFRTRGDTGWYSEKWGGGIYQADPDWVRIYNDKGLATGGTLVGGQVVAFGNMTATGRLSTNEFLSIGGVATEGAGCGDNKLIAKTATGTALSCEDGVWKTTGGKDRWGGSYWTATHSGGCPTPNPYTGSCSCPAGYQASTQFAVQVGGCLPCISYTCFRPE